MSKFQDHIYIYGATFRYSLSKEFDQKSNQKQQNIKTFIEMFIHEGIKYRDKHCLFICRGGQPNCRCGLTAALPLLNCMTLQSRAQVNL